MRESKREGQSRELKDVRRHKRLGERRRGQERGMHTDRNAHRQEEREGMRERVL